jgi:Cof subfamily protein (haloacid dehalogenase superfamily)
MFIKEKNLSNYTEYKPNIVFTENIEEIINNYNVNKILLIERNEEKYIELSKRVLDFDKVAHTQSSKSYLDIGPLNNSKGKAVKLLCKDLGFKLDEVIAFGDQINDISMISIVGLGVAMGNARDEVKEIADFITLTNDENGVATTIKTEILK